MILGVPKETVAGEKRVALTPEFVSKLKGVQVLIESGAGESAGYSDASYKDKGATIATGAESLYSDSDIILKVVPPTSSEAKLLKKEAVLISFLYPSSNRDAVQTIAEKGASALAMDMMPRISRAQSMDALSSQSTVSGYKSVILASASLPKFFPMLITAAGTISPAKVFVIGAGVAGLQAIATARRMGALIDAYDLRPAVKEQIESLGAKFVSLPLEAKDSQTSGGYAKAQSDEFYQKQQEFLAKTAAGSDVVITTALVPGKRAPILISEAAVKGMRERSVIVDLAAEQGGNCALTEPGKTVIKYGVTIHGLLNLPSSLPAQASQMYSRNVTAFLAVMLKDGLLNLNLEDELIRGTLVVHNGKIVGPLASPAPAGGKV